MTDTERAATLRLASQWETAADNLEAAAPEVKIPRSAVAWSALSSRPARANRATISSASSTLHAGAPRRTAAARSSSSPRI